MSRSFKAVIDVCLSACSHVLLVGETRNQLASPSQIYFHFLVQGRGVGKIPTAVQEMIPSGVVDHFFSRGQFSATYVVEHIQTVLNGDV